MTLNFQEVLDIKFKIDLGPISRTTKPCLESGVTRRFDPKVRKGHLSFCTIDHFEPVGVD